MEIKEVNKDLQVVWHPHPVNPLANREIKHYTIHEQSTVRDLLIAHGINQHQPIVIFVDDKLLTVAEWDTVRPKNGQIINVQASVADGGDGSNVLQMVAMIALIVVVSYFTMGAGASSIGLLAGSNAAMAIGATAMIAGSLLINTVFAAQTPSLDMNSTGGAYGSASPTYSLSGSQNRARPYESMPVIYGQMKWTPDQGMNPYVQYKGDDQYLYQIFNLGLSTCTHSSFKIGDTLVSSYEDVTWSYPDAYGRIKSFPGNVDTDAGSNLTYAESWIYKTTSINTYQIGIDLEAILYYANDSGGLSSTSVELEINYRKTGTSTWLEPSEILVSGSSEFVTGDYVDVSVTKETGSYESVWSDEIQDWTWIPETITVVEKQFKAQKSGGTIVITGASQTPLRATIYIRNLAADQYDFRIRRVTADSTDARYSKRTSFSSYKSYQVNNANYKGQTRYGLTIRASDQLNGVIQQLNVVSSAKVNYYNGTSWVFGYTNNPAYIFMDFCIGRIDMDGKLTYGLGLKPWQIDTAGLRQWASFCATEGLTFNAVIDGGQTSSDILMAIARCGFASPSWASGKIGVIWDKRNQSPVAAFGMSNIIKGSFEVSYITEQIADEIIVNYVDADSNWETTEVRKKIPGVTNPIRPSSVNLFGCTNKAMAGKFANYLAAQQYYRKRRISWQTDFEGFICNRGDVVLLSHDLTQWGYSGRIVSVDGTTVTLDREVPRNGSVEYLMIKQPNGTMTTYEVVAGSGNDSVIELTDAPTLQSGEVFDHIWMFSPLETPGKKVKIISIQPASESRLNIVATDEDPEFYAAWDGTFEEPTQYSLLQQAKKPVIANLKFAEELAIVATGRIITRCTIYWQQKSSQLEKCDVRYRINNGPWSFKTVYGDTKLVVDFDGSGPIEATVTPVNGYFSGNSLTGSAVLYGKTQKPSTPTGLTTTVSGTNVILDWNNNPELDLAGYEVRGSDSGWGQSSGRLFKGASSIATLTPPASGQTFTWYVKAYDTSGNYSEVAASKSFTSAIVNNTTSISHSFYDDSLTSATITLDWPDVSTQFGTSYYEVTYDTVVKTIKASTITLPANWIGNRTFTVKTVDFNGNKSSGYSVSVTKLIPLSPTNIRTQVIDNTVMLYWRLPSQTTLPINHVLLKKGDAWDSAEIIGNKDGEFTTINELRAGTYKYWLATVDTDGNESVPVSISANVAEPPDFVFNGIRESSFGGTFSSAILFDGSVILPISTTQSWQDHFSSRAWSTPNDQVTAGYPIYIQPGSTSGYYQETFDFDTVLGSSKITVSAGGSVISGSPTVSCKIETSSDNATWTVYDGVYETYGLNFRYARITITVTGSDSSIYKLDTLSVRCDSKQKSDSGTTSCVSSDTLGTVANFNKEIIDVTSISVTGAGTTPVIGVYDFQDYILSGTYSVSSNVITVNATAHGFIAGQNIRLGIQSGTAPVSIVTISTASANSFTATLVTANTSGNLTIYPQSMRIYLFNNSGSRVSGTASWTVRGY